MPNIQLRDMRILNVHFSVNEQFSESLDNIEFQFNYGVESTYDNIENAILVKMMANTATESKIAYPFNFNMTILGIFEVDPNIDAVLVDQLSNRSCPAILFPFLREAVADLTRRAGFPPLYLPVVNFIKQANKEHNIVENREQDSIPAPRVQSKRSRKSSKHVKHQ